MMEIARPSPATPAGARPSTGDAVHKDLYKVPADPAIELAEHKDQARILGLGFFFFGLIITTLSLAVNGGFSRDPAFIVAMPGEATMDPALAALDDKQAM
ncbi:MAG TPA: hypothetical protein PKY43_12155, partial [Thauera aminoaromatica]|nr:hypothetical protein [Thauera aminoaromatica]